jgi:hypothetical protein
VAKYIKREIWIEETEVDLPARDVMTISEAARYLGVYPQAVSLALDRGDLTVIINRSAPRRQGRRLVLRAEVEAWKARREKRRGPQERGEVTYTW